MVGVDDDVLTAESCHVELLGTHASEADSLPDARYISGLGGVECILVLLQVDVGLGEFLLVRDTLV